MRKLHFWQPGVYRVPLSIRIPIFLREETMSSLPYPVKMPGMVISGILVDLNPCVYSEDAWMGRISSTGLRRALRY